MSKQNKKDRTSKDNQSLSASKNPIASALSLFILLVYSVFALWLIIDVIEVAPLLKVALFFLWLFSAFVLIIFLSDLANNQTNSKKVENSLYAAKIFIFPFFVFPAVILALVLPILLISSSDLIAAIVNLFLFIAALIIFLASMVSDQSESKATSTISIISASIAAIYAASSLVLMAVILVPLFEENPYLAPALLFTWPALGFLVLFLVVKIMHLLASTWDKGKSPKEGEDSNKKLWGISFESKFFGMSIYLLMALWIYSCALMVATVIISSLSLTIKINIF